MMHSSCCLKNGKLNETIEVSALWSSAGCSPHGQRWPLTLDVAEPALSAGGGG